MITIGALIIRMGFGVCDTILLIKNPHVKVHYTNTPILLAYTRGVSEPCLGARESARPEARIPAEPEYSLKDDLLCRARGFRD